MFTYQVRKRKIRFYGNDQIAFPSKVLLTFILKPLQPFGIEYDGGMTAISHTKSQFMFDSNTGHISICAKEELTPINSKYTDDTHAFNINGNIINIESTSNSVAELEKFIESLFFQIPILLNLEYLDAPYITRVEGNIGNTNFGWEIVGREVPLEITNKNKQEEKAIQSWQRYLFLNNETKNKRIFAALHYFHVACRLKRSGNFPWEFMSEIILNYCKILEVLFPSSQTIDSARKEMTKLGISTLDIDKYYIPSIALRNQIDVAHVDLATFEAEELQILHNYTEVAESKFRNLLHLILGRIQAESYSIPMYTKTSVKKEKINIIERMRENFK